MMKKRKLIWNMLMGEEFMQNDRKPMLLVLAGPNGSGKSTITDYFDIVGEYTNADDVVRATGMDNKSAAELVDEKRYRAIQEKRDFTFETVLSSEYKMKIIRKAKEEGYFIKCIFVLTTDPMLNVFRVEARVADGGHNVPKEKIISRYNKSLNNVKELVELCDILHIYDNTDDLEKAEQIQRIFRKHKAENFRIIPNQYWNEQRIRELIGLN